MKKLLIGIAVGGMMLTSASAAEARNQRNDGPTDHGVCHGVISLSIAHVLRGPGAHIVHVMLKNV